ncbi:MAG: sodium-dependent transporter [Melioribacteraceae bacterium]|jgi:NSS family neurotransmitter:Na+ symporter|nr:sodium-dependent transporter [Melioribacteraceae bacterium]
MQKNREQWNSKIGFILAAAGSAIGLGNIWKFPYIAGEYGGASFIFIYLICIAIIGLPVLIAEILIGRTTHRNPVGAFKALSQSKFWIGVGGMGVVSGFLILSFYAVIAGWAIGYILEAVVGNFAHFNTGSLAAEHFTDLVSDVPWILGYFTLFMILTMLFVYLGIQKGIERGSKIMMPILLVLLVILMVRGITLEGADKGLEFLLYPDWSKINAQAILVALGHAFFTLSLGMGAMLTYGSYMSKKDSVLSAALQIIILDTVIALIAGVAIFTSVFAVGLDPSAGPGLIFHTIPAVFAKMPGGYFFSILFFILLSIAALTSAISLLEVVVAYFVDDLGWNRKKATIVMGFVVFLLGLPSALSFNVLADYTLFGKNFFDLVDFLASNIFLPLGGFLIAIFVGYVWGFDKVLTNLREGAEDLFDNNPFIITTWKFFLKYLSPILIFIVLLHSLGVIDLIFN